jgi:pimeloyl-ACP methyl ester carboxylesterase
VEDELDRLGLDAPAIAGNSLGGWLALELARRGRADRVVAIAPSGLEMPAERAYVIAMNEAMRLRARLGAPLGRLATRGAARRAVMLGGLRWTVGARVPTWLREIRVPVRLAFGTADLMLGAYTTPRFALAIPDAELVPLPHLGHVPMNDDPDLVAQTILELTTGDGRNGKS